MKKKLLYHILIHLIILTFPITYILEKKELDYNLLFILTFTYYFLIVIDIEAIVVSEISKEGIKLKIIKYDKIVYLIIGTIMHLVRVIKIEIPGNVYIVMIFLCFYLFLISTINNIMYYLKDRSSVVSP